MSELVTLSVQFACRKTWRVHCCWIKLNLDADKRAHLCNQRFVCVCFNKSMETTTARTAWRRLGCDWALLATVSIYDQNSTQNKTQNPCTFPFKQTKAEGALNKCEQLCFICPETAPNCSQEDRTWWLSLYYNIRLVWEHMAWTPCSGTSESLWRMVWFAP